MIGSPLQLRGVTCSLRNPHRINHSGWVLPVVIVCALLLGANVLTFQFVAATDYMQVRRLGQRVQANALADLASDELHFSILDQDLAPWSQKPPWLSGLLDRVWMARSRDPEARLLDVKTSVDFEAHLPGSTAAIEIAGSSFTFEKATAEIGPFRVIPDLPPREQYYAEPVFQDRLKTLMPLDLRGAFKFEVSVSSKLGPLAAGRSMMRVQELAITDTSPPAAEFALFAFEPPPDEDRVLNELQRGGRLTVFPNTDGRVFVRGPLVLVAEGASAETPHLGGEAPSTPSVSYPEVAGAQWTGWAAVPGPRALQAPIASSLNKLLAGSVDLALGLLGRPTGLLKAGPCRPRYDKSKTTFGIPSMGPWTILGQDVFGPTKQVGPVDLPVSFVISAGLDKLLAYYLAFNGDRASYFLSGSYVHALAKAGSQTFSVTGDVQRISRADGTPTSVSVFRGVRVSQAGDDARPHNDGISLPASAPEGDSILIEPLAQEAGQELRDIGIMGMYGSADFDETTWLSVSLVDLLSWLIPGGISVKLASKLLKLLGVNLDVKLLVQHYGVEVAADLPDELTLAELEPLLESERLVLAPYGLYRHKDGFWSGKNLLAGLGDLAIHAVATHLASALLGKLFSGGPFDKTLLQKNASLPGDRLTAVDLRGRARGILGKTLRGFLRRFVGKWTVKTQHEAMRYLAQRMSKAIAKRIFKLGITGILNSRSPRPDPARQATASSLLESTEALDDPVAVASFPRGYYPSKYRAWERIWSRSYPDLPSYMAAESGADGVLELNGAVFIRNLNYTSDAPIRYRGRGILVAMTTKQARPSVLAAPVVPVSPLPEDGLSAPADWLILAHVVTEEARSGSTPPPLRLGELFTGSVYSDTGVIPGGSRTLIRGNLIAGWINKAAIPASLRGPGEGVTVMYQRGLALPPEGNPAANLRIGLAGDITTAGATQ